jgi:hypothetical protein
MPSKMPKKTPKRNERDTEVEKDDIIRKDDINREIDIIKNIPSSPIKEINIFIHRGIPDYLLLNSISHVMWINRINNENEITLHETEVGRAIIPDIKKEIYKTAFKCISLSIPIKRIDYILCALTDEMNKYDILLREIEKSSKIHGLTKVDINKKRKEKLTELMINNENTDDSVSYISVMLNNNSNNNIPVYATFAMNFTEREFNTLKSDSVLIAKFNSINKNTDIIKLIKLISSKCNELFDSIPELKHEPESNLDIDNSIICNGILNITSEEIATIVTKNNKDKKRIKNEIIESLNNALDNCLCRKLDNFITNRLCLNRNELNTNDFMLSTTESNYDFTSNMLIGVYSSGIFSRPFYTGSIAIEPAFIYKDLPCKNISDIHTPINLIVNGITSGQDNILSNKITIDIKSEDVDGKKVSTIGGIRISKVPMIEKTINKIKDGLLIGKGKDYEQDEIDSCNIINLLRLNYIDLHRIDIAHFTLLLSNVLKKSLNLLDGVTRNIFFSIPDINDITGINSLELNSFELSQILLLNSSFRLLEEYCEQEGSNRIDGVSIIIKKRGKVDINSFYNFKTSLMEIFKRIILNNKNKIPGDSCINFRVISYDVSVYIDSEDLRELNELLQRNNEISITSTHTKEKETRINEILGNVIENCTINGFKLNEDNYITEHSRNKSLVNMLNIIISK